MLLVAIVAAVPWPYACPASASVDDIARTIHLPSHTVVVTGADGRSGFQLVRAAALVNASVILVGRNKSKISAAAASVRAELPGAKLFTQIFDLSSFTQTAKGAKAIVAAHPSIDVLINNAGAIANELSDDGMVGTWQVNAFAPALLAAVLEPALRRAPAPRIINVATANVYDPLPANHSAAAFLQYARATPRLPGFGDYGASKLALVHYTKLQATRIKGLLSVSVNPGYFRTPPFTPQQRAACDGPHAQLRFRPCPQLPAQGAASTAFAALTPGLDAAAGSLIDFATNLTQPWSQGGETCVPRPLPPWDDADADAWYDTVQRVVRPFV